jgi:hypothetical protein
MSFIKSRKNKSSIKKHSYRYGKTRRETLGSVSRGKHSASTTGGKKPAPTTIALLVL